MSKLNLFPFIILFLAINLNIYSKAKVTYIKGECEIKRKNSQDFVALKKDDIVNAEDSVRTSPGSLLKIEFENTAILKILSSSTFQIKETQDGKVGVFISGGNFVCAIDQKSPEQSITLKSPTAKVEAKDSILKFFVEYNKTTVICVKGSIKTGSNVDGWQNIDLITLGTTDKVVLTNLINQTNAPILTADDEELFVDKELFKQREIKKIKKEEITLEEFKREESVVKKIKKEKETGFRFNAGFGAVQLQYNSYFSASLMPEFFYKDFSIALYIPFYLDGYNRAYYPSKWGNYSEWDFKSTQDALGDLLIKIERIKFGNKNDNYYFLIGKLKRFSIGNGFIVRNLNNVESFPMIRRSGLYFNLNSGLFGFQGFIADINVADIQGYRLYIKPLYKRNNASKDFEMGITCSFDANPTVTNRKNPSIFAVGIDMGIPVYWSQSTIVKLKIDIADYGFRYSDDSAQGAASLPDYDSTGAGFNFLKAFSFQFAIEIDVLKIMKIDFGIVFNQKGFTPEWMDAFYFISRKEKANRIMESTDEEDKIGFHLSLLFYITNAFQINIRYLLMSNSNKTTDKIYFAITSVKGTLWKFHLRFVYEKIDFFKSTSNFMQNCLLTAEIGFIWSENLQVVGIAKRFYDTSYKDYRTFLLETRMTF